VGVTPTPQPPTSSDKTEKVHQHKKLSQQKKKRAQMPSTHQMVTRSRTNSQKEVNNQNAAKSISDKQDANVFATINDINASKNSSATRNKSRKKFAAQIGDPYKYSDYPETGISQSHFEEDDASSDDDDHIDTDSDSDSDIDPGYGGSSPVHSDASDQEEEAAAPPLPPILEDAEGEEEFHDAEAPDEHEAQEDHPEPEHTPGTSSAAAEATYSEVEKTLGPITPVRPKVSHLSSADKFYIGVRGVFECSKSVREWAESGLPRSEKDKIFKQQQQEVTWYRHLHDVNSKLLPLTLKKQLYAKAAAESGGEDSDLARDDSTPSGRPTRSNSTAPDIWPLPSGSKAPKKQ
jgi:hypothetical protein